MAVEGLVHFGGAVGEGVGRKPGGQTHVHENELVGPGRRGLEGGGGEIQPHTTPWGENVTF